MPKVSVIIPVYNVEKYLRQCLDSVVNQTLKDIEIICINDGSTDNSAKILDEYALKDDRIKIIGLKENVGIGKARNIAFKEVTAPYVMYLDSDDWYELDACKTAYNQIVENNNDFVLYRAYCYYDNTKQRKLKRENFHIIEKYVNMKNIKYNDLDTIYFDSIAPWFKIHKVSYLKEHNIFFEEGMFYEDQPFWYMLILTKPDFSIINRPLINYRQREGSITKRPELFIDSILVKSKTFKLYLAFGNQFYIEAFVINCLQTIPQYLKLAKRSFLFNIKNYNKYRDFVRMIDSNFDSTKIKDKINYREYRKIIKYNLVQRLLLDTLKNIFSVCNTKDKKHKVITILGIKVKFKRAQKSKNKD